MVCSGLAVRGTHWAVLVAALLFFSQTDVTNVAAKSVSARQRQQEKKIKVLQTWGRAHSYLSGTSYVLFCCYCCRWSKWEIFQFEMLQWISVSTVKLVTSKHCSIAYVHKRSFELPVGRVVGFAPSGGQPVTTQMARGLSCSWYLTDSLAIGVSNIHRIERQEANGTRVSKCIYHHAFTTTRVSIW